MQRSQTPSDDSDGSARWSDWKSEVPDEPITSFFGAHTLATASDVWNELKDSTGFDFTGFATERGLDGYSRVRLVNYLRRCAGSVGALRGAVAPALLARDAPMWTDESLLAPVLQDDALIMDVMGFDDEGDDAVVADGAGPAVPVTGVTGEAAVQGVAAAPGGAAATAASIVTVPSGGVGEADTVESLRSQLQQARALIARLTSGGARDADSDGSGDDEADGARGNDSGGAVRFRSGGVRDNDTYYFNSYARSSIHAVRGVQGALVAALQSRERRVVPSCQLRPPFPGAPGAGDAEGRCAHRGLPRRHPPQPVVVRRRWRWPRRPRRGVRHRYPVPLRSDRRGARSRRARRIDCAWLLRSLGGVGAGGERRGCVAPLVQQQRLPLVERSSYLSAPPLPSSHPHRSSRTRASSSLQTAWRAASTACAARRRRQTSRGR